MYQIKWDPLYNSVILVTENGDIGSPVRPVFYEELDIIGLSNLGYSYPKIEGPILFASLRNYYYRGEKIFSVNGGGFFEDIFIEIYSPIRDIDPVDMRHLIKMNKHQLNILTHDSIDFIRTIYKKYQDSVDAVVVSFSGGKDSVVVTDLVKRAVSQDAFLVAFADTSLESPYTYAFIDQFKHENINLNFHSIKPPREQIDLWKEMGPPSRIQRWCHIVYKTAPIRNLVKEIFKLNNPLILLFDGIRSEESARRSSYSNLKFGTNDMKQINVSPILNWSSLEVFLYLFFNKISFNKCYRYGYPRVGCIICPFTSKWSDFLSKTIHSSQISPYIDILRNNAIFAHKIDLNSYINEGGWKSRSGGLDLTIGGNRVFFEENHDNLTILMGKNIDGFFFWLNKIGPIIKDKKKGYVIFNKIQYNFSIKQISAGYKVIFYSIGKSKDFKNSIRKIAYKAEYCINCGACLAVCPTGVLSFTQKDKDQSQCLNCGLCINYMEKGCLVAKSITLSGLVSKKSMSGKGMNRYQTFGMRQEWLQLFISGDSWQNIGDPLGKNQIEALRLLLKDAEFFNGKTPTDLGQEIIEISDSNDLFVWSVMWTNLAYNSPLFEFYVIHIGNSEFTKTNLVIELAKERGSDLDGKMTTENNGISSLIQSFLRCPFGEQMSQGKMINSKEKIFKRFSFNKIPDLAVLYSLRRYSEKVGRNNLVLSEIIKTKEISPSNLFMFDFNFLKTILIKIASNYPQFLSVEFAGNLDNIILNSNLTDLDIIQEYKNKKGN